MFLWFAFKRQQEHFYQEADAIMLTGNRTAANFPTSELYIYIFSQVVVNMSNNFVCGGPQRRVHGKMGTRFQLPLPMTLPPRKQKNKRNPGDGAVWGQGGGDESVSLGPQLKTFAGVFMNMLWGSCGTWICVCPPCPQYLRTTSEVIQSRQAQVCGSGSHSGDTVSNLFTVHLP